MIIASVLAFGSLPFAKGLQIIDFNIGIFFLLAVSSIGIVGILLAGWSSNNKYTLIGAMRSGAQMISYELSIGLSILTMVMLAGTMSSRESWKRRLTGGSSSKAISCNYRFRGVSGCRYRRNKPWPIRPPRG